MTKYNRFLYSLISFAVTAGIIVLVLGLNGTLPKYIQKFENALDYSRAFSYIPGEDELYIHVIDVGQGDAILVRSNHGNILIDTGTDDSEDTLAAHLRAAGVKKVDYLICSHAHSDHMGGIDAVFENFEVGTLIIPKTEPSNSDPNIVLLSCPEVAAITVNPSRGETFTLGDILITSMAEINTPIADNDASLVIKLTFGENVFLFPGDISSDIEYALISSYQSGELDCDFLKVAHHGSNTSTSSEFISALTPSIASISCGAYNSYGHPSYAVLDRLSKGGCENILRTDKMGSIILRCDESTITVIASKEGFFN